MPINNGGKRNYTGFRTSDQANHAFVIVFDSKRDEKINKLQSSKRKATNQLAFINVTDSGQPAPGSRELIRTHVMSDYWRKQALKKNQNYNPGDNNQDLLCVTKVLAKPPAFLPLLSQPLSGPDPFSMFPFKMEQVMYTILDRCELLSIAY